VWRIRAIDGIAEAREVNSNRAMARRDDRRQQLGPHPAIGHACMQQHDRRPRAHVVVRQHHTGIMPSEPPLSR
jgi:hypothetical protein